MHKSSIILIKKSKLFSQTHDFSFVSLAKVVGVKAADFCVFAESITDSQVAVYGNYNLLVCYQNVSGDLETVYSMKCFSEAVLLDFEPSALKEFRARRNSAKINAYFSKGPEARFIPTPSQIMQTLMKLTGHEAWKKLQVDVTGEISVEVMLPAAGHSEPVQPPPTSPAPAPQANAGVSPSRAEPAAKTGTAAPRAPELKAQHTPPVFYSPPKRSPVKLNVDRAEYEKIVEQLKGRANKKGLL